MPLNLPMVLTWARIAMIPLVVGVFYLPDAWLGPQMKNITACTLFTIAAITDAFDGYFARKYGLITRLGALVGLVIIGREIAVSALREWMAQIGKSSSVAVNWLGRLKTIAQMVAIPMLLFHDRLFGVINVHLIGTLLIYMAAVLTVYSMLIYLRMAWPHMQSTGGE